MRFSLLSSICVPLLFASGMGALALPVTIPTEASGVSTRDIVQRRTDKTALNSRAVILALLDELDRRDTLLDTALLPRVKLWKPRGKKKTSDGMVFASDYDSGTPLGNNPNITLLDER